MTEPVGQVCRRGRRGAEPLAHRPADQQIAHECLPADEELIGLHVHRADLDPACGEQGPEPRLLLRPQLEVVLKHNGLPIEREGAKRRITFEHIEQVIDNPGQPQPEPLEWPIPLAVPMRVGHDEEPSQPLKHGSLSHGARPSLGSA
ncbi:MAG TPA: hypothetical protein VGH93_06150 [Solirubrobacteraceae bacterium]|jgi:hypothetical protein